MKHLLLDQPLFEFFQTDTRVYRVIVNDIFLRELLKSLRVIMQGTWGYSTSQWEFNKMVMYFFFCDEGDSITFKLRFHEGERVHMWPTKLKYTVYKND